MPSDGLPYTGGNGTSKYQQPRKADALRPAYMASIRPTMEVPRAELPFLAGQFVERRQRKPETPRPPAA